MKCIALHVLAKLLKTWVAWLQVHANTAPPVRIKQQLLYSAKDHSNRL